MLVWAGEWGLYYRDEEQQTAAIPLHNSHSLLHCKNECALSYKKK